MAPKEVDFLLERIGQGNPAAPLPKGAAALRLRIMHEEKVAYAPELDFHDLVVPLDIGFFEMPVREEFEQHGDAALDEMNAGCFQRLQETRREAECDAVPHPEFPSPTRCEGDANRTRERLTVDVREEQVFGLAIALERASIDVPVANAVLQRNAPLPTGLPCHHRRVGGWRRGVRALYDDGAVTREPVVPRLVPGLKCLLDEDPAKTGAIDEQIAGNRLAAIKRDRTNESVFRSKVDMADFALDALYATGLGKTPKVARKERRIEMKRIGDLVQGRVRGVHGSGELALRGGHGLDRILFERRRLAVEKRLQPAGGKRHRSEPRSGRSEGMKVEAAGMRPVPIGDPQFECRPDLANEFVFVDAELADEIRDRRDRGLAHPDGGDFVRLQEANTDAQIG